MHMSSVPVFTYDLLGPSLDFLAASSHGSPVETHKSGRSPVFSLFNLKGKSRFWSEDVIHNDFDEVKFSSHGKVSAFNYTNSGNIANYLKLQEIDSIYLPVPINFIFIGFEGKGNQEFKLLPEEIERWFTKIDHIFEHTRIRHEEVLTAFYKTSVDKIQWHPHTVASHINYNFSVHAIEMGEKVTSIFELAIKVFGRKDDPVGNGDNDDGDWQVDVDMIDGLLTSLVEYLQLENAYNIFILNPKRDERRPKYGYRPKHSLVYGLQEYCLTDLTVLDSAGNQYNPPLYKTLSEWCESTKKTFHLPSLAQLEMPHKAFFLKISRGEQKEFQHGSRA
ncbi:hypothetical protein TSUD_254490 [Trifolium subterraneum]|uniref:Uncharacterized protein n=1 Tax=Trifolium subterraneum TaxID=3900 RepID=A0A2Z6NWI4_TRISU|nr:hypothetical protein TSUD_254490 [Trifolium subterraneum]